MGLHIVYEGHGEHEALPILVGRMAAHLGLHTLPHVARDALWRQSLVTESKLRDACELVRGQACDALLLTRDADNDDLPDQDCPRKSAPAMAKWIHALELPFPTAVVLFYKEYETLFVAGAAGMAGKEIRTARGRFVATIPAGAMPHEDPEHPRDAKGWVRSNLVHGYKETLLQASLTRLLDLDDPGAQALSSYRRLANALTFLSERAGTAGAVYPPPAEDADA